MTKPQIIERLYKSKNFTDCIGKMEPVQLQDDLRQEVALIVCEMPEEKIIGLFHEGKLEFYVVRIILNLVNNNQNKFYKTFRERNYQYWDDVPQGEEDREGWIPGLIKFDTEPEHEKKERLEERAIREQMEDITLEEIDRLYWYDAEMIRLYLKLGTFRAMQKQTGIPHISCFKNIKKSLITLKKVAIEGVNKPVFTKQETQFIQNG